MKRIVFLLLIAATAFAQAPAPEEHDFTTRDFKFRNGESLSELKLHYTTYGKPATDAQGRTTNAVLILHGTGGTGRQFVRPQFAGVLFGPGQLLDASKYFIVVPDNIGHGHSSKPSDGLHAKFPHYDYDDMVAAQHLLLTEALHVNHLRLVMGTSMGCMHSWVWLETYPDFMDAAMPLACEPTQIAGRNRMWRKMVMDAIRLSPDYNGGDYAQQPFGLRTALDFLIIAGSAPMQNHKDYPTRDKADEFVDNYMKRGFSTTDANDFLYAVDSSRNYNPEPNLEKIIAPVMFVNSADDFINPPDLGIPEREIKRVKKGKFVLLPISDQTRGHGTHTLAAIWQQYLKQLLDESAH
jgi:homoserine O-acetyltransferase